MRMENLFDINVHLGWFVSHQQYIENLHIGDNE